jgi:hypothetical protein
MKSILPLILAVSFCFFGCDDKPAPPETPKAPEGPAAQAAHQASAEVPAFEPEYTVAIEESTADPKTYTVTWAAKVNSDGWTLKTENVLVEEHNAAMACRIWATLEQPGPADKVTPEPQTVTGKHDAGEVKIERVELSVRRTTRGEKPEFAPLYSVVKTIKYPY